MAKNPSAKTFIRALFVTASVIFVFVILYTFSYRPCSLLPGYESKMRLEEQELVKEAEVAKSQHNRCLLLNVACKLSQLKLRQNNPILAEHYMDDIFKIAEETNSGYWDWAHLLLFAGNIYRDCAKYLRSEHYYQKFLEYLTAVPGRLDKRTANVCTAIGLNNRAVNFYLLAEAASTKEERISSFALARQCLEKAKRIVIQCNEPCLKNTIQKNLQQCSTELQVIY